MLLSLSLRYAENANANVEPRGCSGVLGQWSTRPVKARRLTLYS
ncbi:MAG: hypothetical protein ACKN9W_06095 [Methylococcus sp.]